jgi:hypothetical protein
MRKKKHETDVADVKVGSDETAAAETVSLFEAVDQGELDHGLLGKELALLIDHYAHGVAIVNASAVENANPRLSFVRTVREDGAVEYRTFLAADLAA